MGVHRGHVGRMERHLIRTWQPWGGRCAQVEYSWQVRDGGVRSTQVLVARRAAGRALALYERESNARSVEQAAVPRNRQMLRSKRSDISARGAAAARASRRYRPSASPQ